MRPLLRIALLAMLVIFIVTTWTACSSDGYEGGSTTVYVSHGYGGYGPGWGYGWGGYGGYHPPPVMGPPVAVPY